MKLALEIGAGESPAMQPDDGYEWRLLEHPDASAFTPNHGLRMSLGEWGGPHKLPFNDATFDLVYAAHVLEHVPWMHTGRALAEAYRILKPGGVIEIWVPNFAYLVDCYREQECGDDWRHENPNDDPMTWLNGRLFTYGPEPNFHKACFDSRSLRGHLHAAGFSNAKRIDFKPKQPDLAEHERGHRHGRISLGVRASK
jgi:predicted SAM-dependent methyltransferase